MSGRSAFSEATAGPDDRPEITVDRVSVGVRVVQDAEDGAEQETPVPGPGAAGRAVHVRGGQRAHVHAADRADVRHRAAVHRARVLDGVRHAAGQVRVPHQPQRRRVPSRALPGAVALLRRGHTAGHRRPVAHLLAAAAHVVAGT